jgi:hypothetical protein
VGDISAIASSVKGWLYQEMLIKPQEIMMYRQTEVGGLGVFNVKIRSTAIIHTFLSHAISPRFPANMYDNTLYRWHLLEQRDLPNH